VTARPVVVSHPVHQHAYKTALAAQERGLLEVFWTGFYRAGRGISSPRLLALLPGPVRAAATRELSRRWDPALDPALVKTVPAYDAVSVAWRRLLGARGSEVWDPGPWMLRRFDGAVARRLRRNPPALVHAFEGSALSTLGATRSGGGATVLDCPSAHERFIAVKRAAGDLSPDRTTARVVAERDLADRLLAPSEQVVTCLLEHGVPAERVVLLPYGVDPDLFAVRSVDREDDLFRVLFVGSIEARKGISDLLTAWRLAGLPDAELVLLGRLGPRGGDLLRDAPRGVRWHHDVPHGEVPTWFAASDVFAFPSLAEGSAYVTYEAMAAGLASVVTEEAGSVVRDGRDGFVIPAGDPAALADRLSELHRRSELREAMGRSARAAIEERWTWRHYGERLAAVWSELLSRTRP
jgi:glycosyltransferase involved in cell wall biosynthesis